MAVTAATDRMAVTAATASGSGVRAERWRNALILVVTRRCDLRCAYCPTVKTGEPDLTPDDARRAMALFVARYRGGDAKLFGGEPLLVPDVVRAAVEAAPPEVSVYLSTNGTHLDEDWIAWLHAHPTVTLTLSLDGEARDHDGLRRGAPSHAGVVALLPKLLRLPRFVVTQTIAPSTAGRAAANFRYLRELGVRRFNLLPGYYIPWKAEQLAALRASFAEIASQFEAAWAAGERLYLRNLFVRAPVAFYNTGFVVDSDRRIYANNLILAGNLDHLRERFTLGTLDNPPDSAALTSAGEAAGTFLRDTLGARVMESTAAADAALTALCNRLYPTYFARRDRAAES
jgi:sulfatase maturation enzyme AslB (radical SAM superfamily)